MKTISTLTLCLCLSCCNMLFSQKYFVAFCSKQASSNSFGHAFITVGKGDPFTCNIDGGDGEAWGLYAGELLDKQCIPRGYDVTLSYFVGTMPGCLYDDIRTELSNYYLLRISFEEYLSVLSVIKEWKYKSYQLSKNDCLSFVIAVANVFKDRIYIPERAGYTNFPNRYIKEMIRVNKK